MTDLKTLSNISVNELFAFDEYLSKAPHEGKVEGDAITLLVGKGAGWMHVTKIDDVWHALVYLGECGDNSQGVFYDTLTDVWLEAEASRHTDDKRKDEELLQAMGLLSSEEDKNKESLALLTLQSWLNENVWVADTRVKYVNISRRIPSLSLESAGGVCPFQADGTLDGYQFYFRYRNGSMTLRVGSNDGDLFFKPMYSASMEYGDEYGGSLSSEQFEEVFTTLVKELKKSDIFWEFAGTFTQDYLRNKAGDPSKMGAWGRTAEEAWKALNERVSEDITAEQWQEYLRVYGLRFEPITVDDRTFPETDPDFTVLD